MKQLKNLLPLMLLALLTWNCQNEDIHPVHEGQASKEIYATADQGEVLDLLLDNSGKAGKNGQSPYVDYDMDGLALEEITETDAKLMVIPARTKHKGQQSRILALRVRDTLRTVVFNMYPNTKGGQDGPFSGEITLATLQGELLGGYKVEEGRLAMYYALEGSANGEALQSKASDDECRQWCGHHWSDPTCICNTQHLEGVTVTAPNNQSITYMPLNGLHMGGESPYGDGGMGGNYWDYGGAGGGGSNPSFDFEDKITNNLTGKAKCVYDKLKATNLLEVGIIQRTYIAFNDNLNYKNHHLTFNTRKLGLDRTGQTFYISDSNYEIVLNSDYIDNRSPIEIARTILHESVHALLLKQAYGDGQDSFIEIFKDYIQKTTGLNELHHSIMRDKYVIPIANGLQNFDNNAESFSFYENLAWSGLHQQLTQAQLQALSTATNYARSKGLNCN